MIGPMNQSGIAILVLVFGRAEWMEVDAQLAIGMHQLVLSLLLRS